MVSFSQYFAVKLKYKLFSADVISPLAGENGMSAIIIVSKGKLFE
jgi:hypothetical protein